MNGPNPLNIPIGENFTDFSRVPLPGVNAEPALLQRIFGQGGASVVATTGGFLGGYLVSSNAGNLGGQGVNYEEHQDEFYTGVQGGHIRPPYGQEEGMYNAYGSYNYNASG